MTTVKQPLAPAFVFLWIGFVSAISFVEAWVKFRAPGVSIGIGLGIGRLVFGLLNKIEWLFCLSLLALLYRDLKQSLYSLLLILAALILAAQTFWLLPQLDLRAREYIDGHPPGPSFLHTWYIGAEIVKVLGLGVFGLSLFRPFPQKRI